MKTIFKNSCKILVAISAGSSFSEAAPKWKKIISSSSGGSIVNYLEFYQDTAWTVPAGVTKVNVTVIGAGGGGGGSGSGGGGGGGAAYTAAGTASTSSTGGAGMYFTNAPYSCAANTGGAASVPGSSGSCGPGGASGGIGGCVYGNAGLSLNSQICGGAISVIKEPGEGGHYGATFTPSGNFYFGTGGGGGAVYIWW